MTSNERKILECIRNHGGKVHIQHVVHRTKLSSGYSLFLCRSLAKAGHLEFVNPNVCQLAEKGYGHFSILHSRATAKDGQDHTGTEVVVASSTLQDDESQEDENTGEANKDQEAGPDPAVQQVDYEAGERQEDDLDKKLKELSSDKDEEKIDSSPPTGEGGATREIEENVSGNDNKNKEGATEKPSVNPTDNIGLMIKRFVGLLKGSIKVPESGNGAHGTRHQ